MKIFRNNEERIENNDVNGLFITHVSDGGYSIRLTMFSRFSIKFRIRGSDYVNTIPRKLLLNFTVFKLVPSPEWLQGDTTNVIQTQYYKALL